MHDTFDHSDGHQSAAAASIPRSVIIAIIALAMFAASTFAPAKAGTSEGNDLETVRASVIAKYNYKIDLLSGYMAETDNSARIEVYRGGIAELASVRDGEVSSTTSIDRLWQLKEQAHAIYNETVAAAEDVPMTPAEELERAIRKAADTIEYKIGLLRKWKEGKDDPSANGVIDDGIARLQALFSELDGVTTPDAAYAIKNKAHEIYGSTIEKAESTKTAEEKAAEALAAARRSTLTLIERKTAVLHAAAEAARIRAIVEIFTSAADDVAALRNDAKAATSVKALRAIDEQVHDIYARATDAAAKIRHDGKDDDDDEAGEATNEIIEHVTRIKASTSNLFDRFADTAEDSPDTWADLKAARNDVLNAAAAVAEVAESGNRLGDRWDDLEEAMRAFRFAVVRHHIALRLGPAFLAGFHIAG